MLNKLLFAANSEIAKVGSLFLVLLVINFWGLISNITTHTFGNDMGTNWVYFDFIKTSWLDHGIVPLWNDRFLLGYPIDASNWAALFYPFHLLLLIVPLTIGFNLLIVIHNFLLGLFTYILARQGFKLSLMGSVLAALGMMMTPHYFNHLYLGHLNNIEALTWLPLVLLFSFKAVQEKNYLWSLTAGIFLALMVLVFSIYYVYALFLIGIYYGVVLLTQIRQGLNNNLKVLGLILITVVSSLFFSAVFVLPFVNFLGQSLRVTLSFWDGAFPSIYRDTLLQLVSPLPKQFYESEVLIYVGLPTLLLSFLGVWKYWKNKKVVFLIVAAFFALTVAFGANEIFYKLYYRLIPVFHYMRSPVRIWILFALSLAILSGYGFDYVSQKFGSKRKILFAFFLAAVFLSTWVYNRDYFKLVRWELAHSSLIPVTNDRIYCLDNCLSGPSGLGNRYRFASGSEATLLEDYFYYMKLAGGYDFQSHSISIPPSQIYADSEKVSSQNPDPHLLGAIGVKYILSPFELKNDELKLLGKEKTHFVYENTKVMPQAYLAFSSQPFDQLASLRNKDFKNTAYLTTDARPLSSEKPFQPVDLSYVNPNQRNIKVSSDTTGYLVLNELYYNGWRVTIDGKAAPIHRVNGVLLGVLVPPGNHDIVFSYRPQFLRWGFLLTVLSLVFYVGLSLKRRSESETRGLER